MPVKFHILDALSRDQYMEVTRETEEEQEIEYTWDDNTDPDISYGRTDYSGKKQCLMTIHLFGMTADGVSLRCDVDGFRPYLYVKVPPSLDILQFKQQMRSIFILMGSKSMSLFIQTLLVELLLTTLLLPLINIELVMYEM